LFKSKEMGVFLAILIMGAILSFVEPVFMTPRNLLNVGRQVSIIGIMAVGMTSILVSGEVDLLVGAIYAMAPIIAGLLARSGVNIWLASLVGLVAAVCIGCINGYLSTRGRLPSFIATLGTMNVVRGLGLTITNAYPVVVSLGVITGPSADAFFFMGGGRLFDVIPMQFVWYLLVAIAGGVLLGLTVFGRRIYAIGGNFHYAPAAGYHGRL
jgi:ribose transport system permease protein